MAKKRKHITLPKVYHPPGGAPAETLAYLNPAEHDLIRRLTDGTATRGPKGVKSYAITTGKTTTSTVSSSGGPGGGSLYSPNRTEPSLGAGGRSSSVSTPSASVSSGVVGSKGGGASAQKPGAGGNSGVVTKPTLSAAQQRNVDTRASSTTAFGNIAQTAQRNADMLSRGTPDPLGSIGIRYTPDRWEQNVSFLAGRTIPPTRQEAALPGYANPYSSVDPRLIDGAADMIRKAEAATGARATINDAYRTYWHQATGSPPKAGQKATPGNSWHQAGTAIDIGAGPVQNYLNANRGMLPDAYGMRKPESMMNPKNPDYPHFQVAGTVRPFPGQTSGLRPPGSSTQIAALDTRVPLSTSVPPVMVASTNPANTDAARIAKRDAALAVLSSPPQRAAPPVPTARPTPVAPIPNMRPPQSFVSGDPRLGMPMGGFPPAPPMAPQMPSDPRIGMSPGGFPPAPQRMSSMAPNDPRVGMPPGGFPARAMSQIATDPRVSTTPLGQLPAAKPKEPSLVWHGVPPMGGALPPEKATALGVWSTNRVPPAAPNVGTIHSQTAQADAPSGNWLMGTLQKMGVDTTKVQKAATQLSEANKKIAKNPGLASLYARLMSAPGTKMTGPGEGNRDIGPNQYQRSQGPSYYDLIALRDRMMMEGASREEIAYIENLLAQMTA